MIYIYMDINGVLDWDLTIIAGLMIEKGPSIKACGSSGVYRCFTLPPKKNYNLKALNSE